MIDKIPGAQDQTKARVRARVLFFDLLENGFLAVARDSSSPPHHRVMENTKATCLATIFLYVWIRAIMHASCTNLTCSTKLANGNKVLKSCSA